MKLWIERTNFTLLERLQNFEEIRVFWRAYEHQEFRIHIELRFRGLAIRFRILNFCQSSFHNSLNFCGVNKTGAGAGVLACN